MAELRKITRKEILDGALSDIDFTEERGVTFDRKIENRDGVTCWLNVTIQMILCSMDYSQDFSASSALGYKLETAAHSRRVIESESIKRLIQHEVEINGERFQHILTGEQGARDILILLGENMASWMDIFCHLYHTTVQTISCKYCQSQSVRAQEDAQLYYEIECPRDQSNMKRWIESLVNKGTDIEEYKCLGCKEKQNAFLQSQIKTEASSNFLIVLIKRSEVTYNNRITATDDITLIDSNNVPRSYTPLSVIYHVGGVRSKQGSVRHYLCDVKSKVDGNWYRTSDATQPKRLKKEEVSKEGYIILYMRKS